MGETLQFLIQDDFQRLRTMEITIVCVVELSSGKCSYLWLEFVKKR